MLLCPNGGTKSIGDYATCNWGEVRANVLVTSGARTAQQRENYRYN